MARKKPADAAKAKAAKQKKVVIVLGCVLALAMAYAVHTMMAMNGGGAKPVAADPSATTTPVAAPATDTPSAAPTLAGSLVDTPAARRDATHVPAPPRPAAPAPPSAYRRSGSRSPP